MAEASLFWGRDLAEYTSLYDIGASLRKPPILSPGAEISLRDNALESIHAICDVIGDKTGKDLDAVAKEIHITMLQHILNLALYPCTFHHLGSPPLISGCIRLMSTVKRSGRSSPFSFEYGYLCFRILTIALGVCLLERANDLNDTVADMVAESDFDPQQIFSEHVVQVVRQDIHSVPSGKHCDWVLGWGQLDGRASRVPLVPRPDVSILLGLLWEDRKSFLQALMSTHSPGLTGVMFLLWRFWRLERVIHANSNTLNSLVSPFCEIVWRCYLITPTYQEVPLTLIHNDIGENVQFWKHEVFDIEDCETVVRAFNNRLVPNDSYLYASLDPAAVTILIGYVAPFIEHGARDLLPSLLSSNIRHMWNWLVEVPERADGTFVDNLRITFSYLTTLLKCVQPVTSDLGLRLIDSAIEHDLLGLTARVMTLLKPVIDGRASSELNRNAYFLGGTETLFDTLCSAVSKELVSTRFHDSLQDWLKYKLYFNWRAAVTSQSDDEENHWSLCGECLDHVLGSLGQRGHMHLLGVVPRLCNYARCPGPSSMTGTQFVCSKCLNIYCSVRCQTADWIHNGWQNSHKELCIASVEGAPRLPTSTDR